MKSLAVSISDGTGVVTLPPDALHLTTEGVPDPTDESLALLEPIDDLEPEETDEVPEVDAAEEVVAPIAEVADEVATGFDPVRLYLRQMA